MLTSKLKFSVSAKGDASLLRPKTVVSSDSVIMAGNKSDLVGRKFTVHLGTPPTAQVQRDPMNQEVYHVCGQIAAVQQDSMTINFGNAGGVRKLLFEQGGPEISVDASDPDLVAVGAKVEVEGTTRGAKFQPSKVTVTREEPITARDLDDNEKKAAAKKGTSPPKTARKPAGKGAGDDAAAGAGNTPSADDDDPLGVFKKDKPKGGKSGAKGSGK
jgi:hypothetical protein